MKPYTFALYAMRIYMKKEISQINWNLISLTVQDAEYLVVSWLQV